MAIGLKAKWHAECADAFDMPLPFLVPAGITLAGAAGIAVAASVMSHPRIYGNPMGRPLPFAGSLLAAVNSVLPGSKRGDTVIQCHPDWGKMREHTARFGFSNVLLSNPVPAALAAEIAGEDPDVIVLAETDGPEWDATLKEHFPLHSYRYAWKETTPGGGFSVVSRLPISQVKPVQLDSVSRVCLAFSVQLPGGIWVPVVAVHPAAPLTAGWIKEWAVYLNSLKEVVPASGPLIILGDFNATVHHGPLRDLIDFTGGEVVTENAATWPQNDYLVGLGPRLLDAAVRRARWVLPLDHFIVRGIPVWRVSLGEGAGSDHRPVYADLGWRPNQQTDPC